MDIHITTRHTQLNDEEHDAAVQAAEHLSKFHPKILRVDVIASEESGIKEAEFTVRVQGHTLVAKEKNAEHMKAIHDARDKVERQLRRLNERQQDARTTALS